MSLEKQARKGGGGGRREEKKLRRLVGNAWPTWLQKLKGRDWTETRRTALARTQPDTCPIRSQFIRTHTLENEKRREKIKVVYLPLLCRETSVYHRTMRREPPALWRKGGHVPPTWRQGQCRSNSNNLRLFVRLPTGPVRREAYPVSRSASFEARHQFLSAHPR